MSTEYTKRAISAGLGIGALALLTSSRASADTPFTSYPFPSTGAPTPRTMPDRLSEIKNVKDFGALGDGIADDTAAIQRTLDVAYGSAASPHGSGSAVYTNAAVFFPPGFYKISSPLTLRSVRGAHIFGSGRFTTTIRNTVGGAAVFKTNGCEYSRFERMNLEVSGAGSVCFDLDWDGTGPCALQSNSFYDMYFESGTYGVRIGEGGFMGSENLFQNCFFANNSIAGLATKNYNALQQSVIGGNFQGCATGIWVWSGSVPVIQGVGFQNQSAWDIGVDNTAGDTYSVLGCRSESVNFARFQNGAGAHISGCNQTNPNVGYFAYIEAGTQGVGILDACNSRNGRLTGNGKFYLRGNLFSNTSALTVTGSILQNI